MPQLNANQKKALRGKAHHLNPLVQIGHQGLTEAVVKAVEVALQTHELIKVKFVQHKDEVAQCAASLAQQTHSETVGIVGHIAILYRRKPVEAAPEAAKRTPIPHPSSGTAKRRRVFRSPSKPAIRSLRKKR